MAFRAYDGIKMGAVLMGDCWLKPEGEPPVRLAKGDCWLMSGGRPYLMGSDLARPASEARTVYAAAENGIAHYGGEADFIAIAGRTLYDPAQAALLLDALPPVVHVPWSQDAEVLSWLLRQMRHETVNGRAGADLMTAHLAGMMFVQVLRAWMAGADAPQTGWLGALRDTRIARALTQMHGEPARAWSVGELAAQCGMSRSAFAARFKAMTGQAPLDYLIGWRMRLAGRSLRHGRAPLAHIARAAGYASDGAFSHAFKRVMGMSPKAWRISDNKKAAE